jgi:hypothetical protein
MPASDITVSAEFELLPPDAYTIAIAPLSGGTVLADKNSAPAGSTVTVTVEPDSGYVLKEGTLTYSYSDGDGDHTAAISGPDYTFVMPASNVTINAEFEIAPPDTYKVTVDTLSGGKIIVDAEKIYAPEGTVIALKVEPDSGYVFIEGSLTYSYDGADHPIVGSGPDYTFVMPAFDVTVSAEFEPLYEVIVGIPDNGKVIVSAEQYVTAGTVISLTVEPDTGYVLKEGSLTYSYDGADHPIAGTGPDYTFVMPAFDVTVSAFFNKSLGFTIEGPADETIAITTAHSAGGTSTDISWTADEWVKFTVESPGYSAEDGNLKWFVSGIEISAASGNSLTIRAKDYVQQSYTITVMIKADGQWYSAERPFKVTQ